MEVQIYAQQYTTRALAGRGGERGERGERALVIDRDNMCSIHEVSMKTNASWFQFHFLASSMLKAP